MTVTSTSIRRARSAGTTDQQRAVLDALSRLSAAKGYAPTVREIADDLAVNVNDVMQKLWRLRRDGVVDWEDGRCRTLRIVEVVA
jgi:SOS-response transcriptional repressor LexA